MKILAISFDYQPKNSPQAIQISRFIDGLCKEHEVLLVTEDNPERTIPENNKGKLTILPVPSAKGSIWPKPIDLALYYFMPFYKTMPDEYSHVITKGYEIVAAELEKGYFPDLMISFGQPMSDHLLADKLNGRYAIPWIAHFSDPWYGNPYSKMFWLTNTLFTKKREAAVLANSHAIIYTNEYTRKFVLNRYPEAYSRKTFVVPHSYDPELYTDQAGKNEKITIRYIGSLYGRRSPLYLFRAIEQLALANDPCIDQLQIEFYGYVSRFYRKHFNNKNVARLVRYMGSVGYNESLKLMSSADILLSIDAPSKVNLFLPSKLVEYLGAGKMILGLTDEGPSKDLIDEMGGITVKSDNVDEIAAAIKGIAEKHSLFDTKKAMNLARAYEVENIQKQFNDIVQIFN